MHIKMTELQKEYLMFKDNDSREGVGTNHYIEFIYNGHIRDFEQAFEKLIESQPMLNARIFDNENFIIEEVLKYKIPVHENQHFDSSLVELKRKELSQKKYGMKDYPLFTIEAIEEKEGLRIFLSIDLLITDGLGVSELIQQLKMFLSNPIMSGNDYSNELLHIQNFYQETRSCERYIESKDYYINNIENIYPAPQINYQTEQTMAIDFLRQECSIKKDLYELLKKKADELSTSVTSILLTSYSLILSKWSKEQNFSINLYYSNRPEGKEYHKIIGNFTSSFLLQTSFDFDKSFKENIQRLKLSLDQASRYKYFETTEVIREMKKKSLSAITPVSFTSLLFNEEADLFDNVLKEDYCFSPNLETYLDFQVKNIGEELNISWNYRSDMFDTTIIDTMFSEYCSLIFGFLNSTEDVISNYTLSKKSELISKYEKYNSQTSKIDFKFNTLKQHLEKTANKYPEKVFATINNTEYTFNQIFDLAQNKAEEIRRIKKEHKKNKVRIAFNGKKNIHSIVCIFACILTNDSFCVVNESFGDEKTEEILSSIQNYIYFKNGELTKISDINVHIDKEEAYVIHTSGTTGQPKGIIITEKAALNTVYDILEKFNITQKDTVMNISNLYFDLSIFDIFGSIICGMSVVFVEAYDSTWFFENDYHNKISIWNSTPALAKEFLLKYKFENLRGILVSGDFVPKKTVEELFCSYDRIQLYALGGATEASIWSNYYDCSSYQNVSTIPYGVPLANQELYIIDSKGDLCDFRVLGEICIAGKGLAKGYLSEKQTNDSFVWNEELKEIIYKTGDLGYLGTDNLIYIVGRVTSEIKHNGYRIDLREIEKYINRQADVSNSVAFIEKMQTGRTRLISAIVCKDNPDIKRQIRSELSKKLPLYMIPNRIISIPEIPLTKNGKVDIKSLCSML
ncbi:AMP-binding protein [Fictibacillus sp. KIGAM418]|uniref:AMP-binding protein n=1 Tax=Fictibacillus marinisediminis TaxID=2878389 RepID=A0A9X1XES5_9BACL|nr:AMP-binding protein [Fictibacillus marinisediminis]MCK6258796.1 AMP-binding protein [Fictibacillus marinisediminis]